MYFEDFYQGYSFETKKRQLPKKILFHSLKNGIINLFTLMKNWQSSPIMVAL